MHTPTHMTQLYTQLHTVHMYTCPHTTRPVRLFGTGTGCTAAPSAVQGLELRPAGGAGPRISDFDSNQVPPGWEGAALRVLFRRNSKSAGNTCSVDSYSWTLREVRLAASSRGQGCVMLQTNALPVFKAHSHCNWPAGYIVHFSKHNHIANRSASALP